MNPNELKPAQLTALTQALALLLPGDAPADSVMKQFFRQHASLGSRDRALIAETAYAVLRRRQSLDFWAPGGTPRQWAILGLHRLMGVSISQLSPALRPDEKDWLVQQKAASSNRPPFAVEAELPPWVIDRLRPDLADEEILALGRALQSAAPLDLRVNTLKDKRDAVLGALQGEGLEAVATPFSPMGIRLQRKIALNRHPLFERGVIEVQDEGSQLLGLLVEPRRGEMVADFCAGAGGKTLLLGALMQSQGRLYAFDTSEKRLSNLSPRLKRSGLSNVHPVRIDSENDSKVRRLAGKIDRVLVDAPCSGLGTLRRNPDLKQRQSESSVGELKLKQAAILSSAARLVKPGGRLVYATCSLLRDENEGVVEGFMAGHPEFRVKPASEVLAHQGIALATAGPFLRLWPHLHQTDGFFAAILERSPAPSRTSGAVGQG